MTARNTPLINNLTKNLSGCSGCGNNDAVYQTWAKAKQSGEIMKFQFTVVIESDTYKQAVSKVPDEFEILSGGVKPETKTVISQGGQQFSRTTTQPTPSNG